MSVHIGLRIPEELISKIDRIAKKEGNPRSAIIRRLLSEALNAKDPDPHEILKIKDSGGGG